MIYKILIIFLLTISIVSALNLDFSYIPLRDQTGYNRVDLFNGNKTVSYENNSINKIYSQHTFTHLEEDEIESILKEMYRVLKPNGTIEIVEVHFSSNKAFYSNHKSTMSYYSIVDSNRALYNYPYPKFREVKKTLLFDKQFPYYWNYIIEPIINSCRYTQVFWENTGLRNKFPATYIRFEMIK